MAYQSMTFYDLPVEETPLDAENLNNIIEGIDEAHSRINNLDGRLDDKLTYKNVTDSETVFDDNVADGTLYRVYHNNIYYLFISTLDKGAQFRISRNGIEVRLYSSANNKWGEWNSITGTSEITDGAVTLPKLSSELKTAINSIANKLDNKDGSVKTNNIEDGSITLLKLSSGLKTEISKIEYKLNDVNSVIKTDHLSDGVVTLPKLSSELKTAINSIANKLDNAEGSVKTNNIADGAVTQRKIMIGSITPDKLEPSFLLDVNSAINAVDLLDTMVANLRVAVEKKLDDKDGSVKLNNLSEELQNIINYLDSTDYMQVYDVGELTERTSLNDPIYTSNTAMWQFSASGELALSIKGEETAFTAELRYIAPYQIITDVETQQIYARRVNKIAPNFSADAWKEKTSSTGNGAPNIEGAVSGDTVYVGDSVKQKLTLEWENGGVSTYPDKLGQEVSSTEYLRTDYCDVSQFASLDFTLSDSAYKYNILWFDSGKNCTGYLEHNASLTHDYSSTIEIPEGVAYARLLLHKNGSMTEDENSVLTVTGNTTGITDFRRMFEGKLTYQKADYSDTVFDDNVEEGTVYSTEYNGRGCLFIASKKRGAYIQFRFSSNGYEWREKTGASWTNWHNGSGNTASERVDISETTNNFTGSYELSDNTITVSGRINISAETNTGIIRPTQYTPINTMSVIGVGSSSSKHYIINVISSTPTLRFTVLNMDGTTPTETDTVRFTATLFKT